MLIGVGIHALELIWNSLSIWLLLPAVVLLTYTWWRRPYKFPPGPRGFPLLGVLPYLDKHPERLFRKWGEEKYGDIMGVRFGTEDVVVLNSFEAVQKTFVQQGKVFSGRPYKNIFKQVTGEFGVILKTYGDDFNIQRKFAIQVLSSFGFGKRSTETNINEEVGFLTKYLEERNGEAINVKNTIFKAVLNPVAQLTIGERFEYDNEEFERIFNDTINVLGNAADATKILLVDYFPPLKYLPGFKEANSRAVGRMQSLLKLAERKVTEHHRTFDKNCIRDFTDAYIYEQKYGRDHSLSSFEDEQMQVMVRDLLMAPLETTGNTMMWMLLILLHHPEHLEKINREIDDVIGSGVLKMNQQEQMPFTRAFILEAMRYKTVNPMSVQHSTTDDAVVDGFHIPKNTTVTANLWSVHNDPETWDFPQTFNPYRHLSPDGGFAPSPNAIPFSVGNRFCMGEKMAKIEIFMIFVNLLQKFEVSKDPDSSLADLDGGVNTLTYSPPPFKIVFTKK